MERIISPLVSLDEVETEFDARVCEIEELVTGSFPTSLQFDIPTGSKGKKIRILASDEGEGIDLALNAKSFRVPVPFLTRGEDAAYGIELGGELFRVAIGEFDTVIVPYRPFDHVDIVVLTDAADCLVLSDLRAVTDELPQDILRGFLNMKLPKWPLGRASVRIGDRKVRLPDITNVVEGATLLIGSHRYQIKGLVGDLATLSDSQDGERILEDYDGEIYIDTPIVIGYVDRDLKLPSVVVWFSSPTPDLRAIRREEYRVFGDFAYIKERTQFEEWPVRLEVAGGSPEMVQAVAAYVRRFLEGNRIWVNGKRFTFEWTDAAVDTEASSYLEIEPSVSYIVNISLQEEHLWQTVQKGSGKLRAVIPTPSSPRSAFSPRT